ncbi:MAG: sigma 54-interacting transcriptional regulator [Gammaproteobacteria bacterium]|jgi:transcriptional regulator with GAF, ATPase, and Fis domain|nr:sigma 54-interacting transcriptional regulator [Gammaproteobacteria bacterium]MBT3858253.1 sigma 54-interacting transcriptional regulator [Gammaproteobacteria bacterium]MBT3988624.1 sigma 54-interacting transcriptional regulator [Gammaproteobacteria bacterium]MBT4256479.1 sigma 54-interacting transcriptional regulator [Gammaproteobacteria bacterium]MBT4580438.1 sigma 54-interacting transcriptional regulator [Gammaproteobacteria bacterium]
MLEGYDCPAILVSADYEILATNNRYREAFGEIDFSQTNHCYVISHGYKVPCDQAGEDCPLGAAKKSGHKARVLHIHQTPKGQEHVDVEMLPIFDDEGELSFFVELLHPVPLASGNVRDQEMVGESEAFKQMLSKVSRVGRTDASVLLLGESGTGKELAARAIHMASSRKDKPLVTLECAGLSDSLFESELFGHVKGAFTGAHSNKSGLVELADGGTLFLDEIGDIPPLMQVKLLRLLETGTFRSVGSAEVRRSDFRLICATHKNLFQMVEEGSFRDDLFYRVNVFPIAMPALQERNSDIPLLAKALLKKMSGEKHFRLTESAINRLQKIIYRGNIRELRNLLSRALVMADTEIINEDVIELCIDQEVLVTGQAGTASSSTKTIAEVPGSQDLKTQEKEHLLKLIAQCDGDKSMAAGLAGISLRSLYRKLGPVSNQSS